MMKKYRDLFSITALMAVLLSTSCLFDSREPQKPGTTTGNACVLDTPEAAFNCMTQAISRQKDADYENSISSDFVFHPTSADLNDEAFAGKPVYDNWTRDVEMQVLRKLFDDTDYTKVDFGNPGILQNDNTFVQFNVDYTLRTVNVAALTDTLVYKANAKIDVRRVNGLWRVTQWDEQSTVEGFRTWGYLRGIIRLPMLP